MRFALKIHAFLFERPTISVWKYSLIAAALALIPSILLGYSAIGITELLGENSKELLPKLPLTPEFIIAGTTIGPMIESLLLILTIAIISLVTKNTKLIVTFSALTWGILHGISAPLWFFGTAWSFFVFAAAYKNWRTHSFTKGYIAVTMPHVYVNIVAFSMGLLAQSGTSA